MAGDAGDQGGYLAAMITYRVRLSFPLLLPLTTVLGTDYRHQARRAATGGVPALQSDRRLGRRGHRPQSCADPAEGPGVSVADDLGNAFTANLAAALGLHRAWDRAASVMASAVPLPADPRGQATPSGRSDRESVMRLTISARPGRRTAAVALFPALRVSRLRLIDPIFER